MLFLLFVTGSLVNHLPQLDSFSDKLMKTKVFKLELSIGRPSTEEVLQV